MQESVSMNIIARIHTDFQTKFGIPRQSGLVDTKGTVVFEPAYRDPNALRGLEGYSHLWLIWQFSENARGAWSPTVRPPRLGGNRRMGVFATRSPFRPNPIGLSSVRLDGIGRTAADGPVLYVSGADMLDNTPIFDIKPYIPYADSHPDAVGGFTDGQQAGKLPVRIPDSLLRLVPEDRRAALSGILERDPRPSYQDDPERVYGFVFAGLEIRFTVDGGTLTVREISPEKQAPPTADSILF